MLGGTVNGVAASGLIVELNGSNALPLSSNGRFSFPARMATGTSYVVTILAQPSNPAQTCVVSNASGTVGNSDVTNIVVDCTTNTYSVGGNVTGLAGSGLVLQNDAGDDLQVTADGSFRFATKLMPAGAYLVTIKTQPANPSQTCVVANASGTVDDSDVSSVAIACTTNSYPVTVTVGGLSGSLTGTPLVLDLNGDSPLTVLANGSFTFPGVLLSGSKFAVTVSTQPSSPSQTCVPTNGSGTVGSGPVTNVSVTCTTNTYMVGGTVSGLSSAGLVLQVNGGQDLAVGANGAFEFQAGLASGAAYVVTVKSPPSARREVCSVANGSGVITNANIGDISVNCLVVVGFVYVVEPNNRIVAYGISPITGVPVDFGSSIATDATDPTIVAAPSGLFLYVASRAANSITIFAVDSDHGGLTAIGPTVTTGSLPSRMAISPSGAYLFVNNYGDGTVQTYQVNLTTGSLTPAGKLSYSSDTVSELSITHDGKFLYVQNYTNVAGNPTPLTITPYAIDQNTGALTAGAVMTPIDTLPTMTIDPLGRYLYLTKSATNLPLTGVTVSPYSIDATSGALTAIGSGTPLAGNGDALAADPTGKYLYFISNLDIGPAVPSITALAVDQTTGVLSQNGAPVSIGSNVASVICDPSGQFVYVGGSGTYLNSTWPSVSAFVVNANGVTAGQLSPSGQGGQFSNRLGSIGAIAIVE
jgi:6-phosphogluconolactonase (cycloisomerase 2 family)